MTYISSTELEYALGTTDYNHALSVAGSATADSTTVTVILTRTDEVIDSYRTSLSTAQKKALAYDIACYLAMRRRGPGNMNVLTKTDYDAAIKTLQHSRGYSSKSVYDPTELPDQDLLDDDKEDPQ